jgi:hypothetical protein
VPDLSAFESGEHLAVYDLLVTYLKEGCGWVERWRTWQGDEADKRQWVDGDCPGIQLIPQVIDDGWQDAATFKGRLVVGVEIALMSSDVRDAARCWRAIKRVFHPEDPAVRVAIRTAIGEAAGGLAPGYVEFRGLQFTPPTGGGIFLARGSMSVLVNETLTP